MRPLGYCLNLLPHIFLELCRRLRVRSALVVVFATVVEYKLCVTDEVLGCGILIGLEF